ncbi:helix-turn-helix domain-containing protein [Streptomyces sp. BG9H]|uniref:Helix-turn-helix domain-containing protein n=1 Tax=Streptomyces anatolicus TaxID=2675858 RepID=A0ABS6YL84_9ACTN|nr:helix-turn-helix domain-containing protein [Streptomyces anatolicus]MBW5422180.1 helix-turn-helix domain-containing protein [Streptomyces anatolicus]
MDLEARVAELERRMAELESAGPAVPAVEEGDFWALEALKARHPVAQDADGAVLFTGAVRVPTGHRYEWQYGRLTESLFEDDWSEAADSFAALGNPVRLRLLAEILAGTSTAAELAALDDIGTTGQIYHHLRQLTGAGWLHSTGRGRHEVPAGRVVPLLVMLSAARP